MSSAMTSPCGFMMLSTRPLSRGSSKSLVAMSSGSRRGGVHGRGTSGGTKAVVPRHPPSRVVAAGAARRHDCIQVIATDPPEAVEDVPSSPSPLPSSSDADDGGAESPSSTAPAALTSKGLGVERGKTLPPVPPANVHWVCDVEGIQAMRRAVLDFQSDDGNPTTREGYPPIVGLDGEWKPGSRTPVSILQVATRTEAFVVDLFACAPSDSPACEAFDEFLHDMLQAEELYKLGFSFGYDLSRMRASYPHLAALRAGEPKSMAGTSSTHQPPPLPKLVHCFKGASHHQCPTVV